MDVTVHRFSENWCSWWEALVESEGLHQVAEVTAGGHCDLARPANCALSPIVTGDGSTGDRGRATKIEIRNSKSEIVLTSQL